MEFSKAFQHYGSNLLWVLLPLPHGVALPDLCSSSHWESSHISSLVNSYTTVIYIIRILVLGQCGFVPFPYFPFSVPWAVLAFTQLCMATTALFSCTKLPFPRASCSPIHIRSSQIHPSCTPGTLNNIVRNTLESQIQCFIKTCYKWWETPLKTGFTSALNACLQANHHEASRVTWRGRQRLCQCWGHSLTCLHSPHWGAALQSTHRMLQMQRLQKAVKNKQHFCFISFQQPPQSDPCSSSCCSTSPLRSGLSITPCTQSIAWHYSCALPKSKYKEPQNTKLCCQM